MLLDSYLSSYLEIPVVLGIGFCQSKLLMYSYLKDQIHEQPETEDLITQIRRSLCHIPESDTFFETPVLNYHLYLYSLGDQYRFLTLVLHENNVIKSFRASQLQQKLQENIQTTKQLFKELSTQRSILGQPISTLQKEQKPETLGKFSSANNENPSLLDQSIAINEVLAALNALSRFTCQYLGPKITSNYWNLARPKNQWLNNFEIKYSAAIAYRGDRSEAIHPLQILALREWTQNFMKQSNSIVRNLPELFEKEGISESHRKILSIYTSQYLHDHIIPDLDQDESLFGNMIV